MSQSEISQQDAKFLRELQDFLEERQYKINEHDMSKYLVQIGTTMHKEHTQCSTECPSEWSQ